MKKNFTLKSILTLIALVFSLASFSQERCGMVQYMEEQMQDPEFARQYQEKQNMVKAQVQQILSSGDYQQRGGGAVIEIPVAVHFPTGNVNDRACLEALAQTQIDILNADYTATNADIATWNNVASANYPGLSPGSANITFCIATANHPTFAQHGDPNLLEGNPAITVGVQFGGGNNTDSDWAGYLNFVIRDLGGLLGFSPLFGNINAGAAVTMDVAAFASGSGCPTSGIVPQAPYNLGRTTTHELGHFFGLNHTFITDQGGGGTCAMADGDGIADTPKVALSTYGCPGNPSAFACNAPERALTMNYMDYVNDACMYMFTPQQMVNVDAYISNIQGSLKPNTCVATDPGFVLLADNSPVSSCPTTDMSVDFNLTYTTILSFNETTTFSATGQPAGSTVTFSPTSLNNDGSFTMTVGNIGATAVGDYTITVTGTSNSVTETVDVELNNNCTEIICTPFTPDPMDLPLLVTDGQAGGGVGNPIAQITVNVPDTAIIDGMTVSVDLTHTYVQDLILQLLHPDGTTFVNLLGQECASENLNNTLITFDDEGNAITCPGGDNTVIPSGTYAPSDPLSTFDGLDAQGDWILFVADTFQGDLGQLNDLTLTICSEQPLSVNEFSQDSFSIFPNPNNGEFTIKFDSNSGNDIKVDVLDIRGRRIFNNEYTNTGEFNETVKLDNVQAGMYLVTVNDGNNKITKRIIVE